MNLLGRKAALGVFRLGGKEKQTDLFDILTGGGGFAAGGRGFAAGGRGIAAGGGGCLGGLPGEEARLETLSCWRKQVSTCQLKHYPAENQSEA